MTTRTIRVAVRLGAGAALTALAPPPGAWAQTAAPSQEAAPAAAETPEAEADEGDIVVVALPSERSSIDRTTYVVRDNAESRSSSTLDLLAQIPSVEVTPAGALRLLGRSGVRILVDGNEVANPTEFLRNLQGSQVARIEVITNPSAQFSAQGSAGIINIITRRTFETGVGGSLTASAGSFGAFEVKASPTWQRGPLSLAGSLGFARSVSPSTFGSDRRRLGPDEEPTTMTRERGDRRNRNQTLTGNVRLSYALTPRQSLSFTGFASQADGGDSRRSQFLSPDTLDPWLRQTASGRFDFASSDLSADYRRESSRQGETLTVAAKRSTFHVESDYAFRIVSERDEPRQFRVRSDSRFAISSLKLDYVRPSAGQRRLSLGAAVQRTSTSLASQAAGQSPFGDDPISSSSPVRGSWLEKAAYATYQLSLLGGTALAGLRVEDRRFEVAELEDARRSGGTHLFPSLHLERRLAGWLVGSLSYSRRIQWPEISSLSPALRFSDSTTASRGNPLLRPEITGSYEAKLQAQVSGQNIDLTLYARRTANLISSLTELTDDGVLVGQPVNLGRRTSRGASLSVRGALGGGFQYSLSGDLADQSIEGGGVRLNPADSGAQYGGSAQLDHRDGVEGRSGADHFMIRLRYSGPADLGLFRISSYFSANASWSHAFTDRLSGVLTVSDIVPATLRSTGFSEFAVTEQFGRSRGPRVTFALTYSLSAPPPQR